MKDRETGKAREGLSCAGVNARGSIVERLGGMTTGARPGVRQTRVFIAIVCEGMSSEEGWVAITPPSGWPTRIFCHPCYSKRGLNVAVLYYSSLPVAFFRGRLAEDDLSGERGEVMH